MQLWKSLNIGIGKGQHNFIQHPCNSEKKIYFFADVPHLLKLVRNNIVDHGFSIDGEIVNKAVFEKVIMHKKSEIDPTYKLTFNDINVQGTSRQKVSSAAHLLSHTMAIAIKFCGKHNIISSKVAETASYIVNLFDKWFDIFNSSEKLGKNDHGNGFGVSLEIQKNIILEVSSIILKMKVGKKTTMLPFQKGILLSNSSLIGLFEYLNITYNMTYILTSRLNQDILENFFATIRLMGATNDHPSALNFKRRLKWYLLGRHSNTLLGNKTNTIDRSNDSCFTELASTLDSDSCKVITESLFNKLIDKSDTEKSKNLVNTDEIILDVDLDNTFIDIKNDLSLGNFNDHFKLLQHFEQETFSDIMKDEGIKYLAGYIAFKFKNKYPELGQLTGDLKATTDVNFD